MKINRLSVFSFALLLGFTAHSHVNPALALEEGIVDPSIDESIEMSIDAQASKISLEDGNYNLDNSTLADSVVFNTKEINDPLEPLNRGVFQFNLALEKMVLRPVATVYDKAVPNFLQDRVTDFLHFLNTPFIFLNDLLQGKPDVAADTLGRFLVNGSVGLFGLFDVMAPAVPYHSEDFGQTLAVWGVGDGIYIMLPIIGPSTSRDGAGRIVSLYADPTRIVAGNTDYIDDDHLSVMRGVTEGLVFEAQNYKRLEKLEADSLDYYTSVRSLYYQYRHAEILDLNAKNSNPKPMP